MPALGPRSRVGPQLCRPPRAGVAAQTGELAPQRDHVRVPLRVVDQQLLDRLLRLKDLQGGV
jgi:hypothetical protein